MRAVGTILGKELRELLRDTHVLTLSLGFPFLFYPLMVWGILQAQILIEGLAEASPPRVAVSAPADLTQALTGEPLVFVDGGEDALRAGEVDALVSAAPRGEGLDVSLKWRSTDARSSRAKTLVSERLDKAREARRDRLARAHGMAPGALDPAPLTPENTAPPEQMTTFLLSRALPTMLVAVMLMAALYPAVEVVAGERERGTVETTLVSARQRGAVVSGKILAVVVMTAVAAAGNLFAMGLTVLHLVAVSDKLDTSTLAISPAGILAALPLTLVSCVFVAVMMVVSVLPCKSFKSGQNVASVTMLVGLGLASLAFLPGTDLTLATALLPLTNTALVLRDAISGGAEAAPMLLALAEMVVLTGALGWLGLSVINSEAWAIDGALPRWMRWLERIG